MSETAQRQAGTLLATPVCHLHAVFPFSCHGSPLLVPPLFNHSYGAGEYFVGVMSKDIPSRFALRVSSAAPVDEVSTHMRTAAAIVDNLSIISKMDPHVRLARELFCSTIPI